MKKLNKRGFTLIELLAVIVILAIIVVVTVPTVLNSIDDARKSTLNSLAKEVATWYDKSYAQDLLVTDPSNKILSDANLDRNGKWYCLEEVQDGTGESVAVKYQLSDNDLNIITKADGKTPIDEFSDGVETITVKKDTCSAIRIVNNRAEVLLVGKANGKFGARYSYSTDSDATDLS